MGIYQKTCDGGFSEKCKDKEALKNLPGHTIIYEPVDNETIKTRYTLCRECFNLMEELLLLNKEKK